MDAQRHRAGRSPHPQVAALSLNELARWPLITYDTAFTGRSRINRAFERIGAQPNIALTALDADVIKTYVSLGLGLGIISALAVDPQRDSGLVALDAGHLFESNTTRLAVRRGTYLRRYDYDLITLFAPHLSKRVVDMAMQGGGRNTSYDLCAIHLTRCRYYCFWYF
jgi:DNA-binding transcriptional LysR family regulator